MKRTVTAFVAVLLIAAAVAGGYWAFVLKPAAEKKAAGGPGGAAAGFAMPVEAAPVRVGEMRRTAVAVGTLLANEMVVVRPEIAGRVAEIGFREGQTVRKGELLLRLDDSTDRAIVAQAQAALALARANHERAESLYRSGSGTSRALDEARAKLLNDEAVLVLSQARLVKMRIDAPFAGIVGLRKVSVGDYLSPGAEVANLAQIDPLKVDFRVPEIYLPAVAEGQTVAIEVDSYPDRVFAGEVFAIDPMVDPAGRSIVMRARIANPDGHLRPGLFARVTLTLRARDNALFVPEEALVPAGEGVTVLRVVDGKVEPVPVKLGERLGTEVEVLSGLAPGDQVITAGQLKVRPGMPVKVAPPQSASSGGAKP
ncbi:MAG: efflux RND transporter periplasmic adaptor subunit [Rhodospirillaceae bacterium]